MRLGLREKILLFTVTPLVTVVIATLWIVNHQISGQIGQNLRADLRRAASALENVWSARGRNLLVAGQVIVQDPRFFSVLTLPNADKDPEAAATVAGVARDFNSLVEADLFDVLDVRGHLLASVGRDHHRLKTRGALVAEALSGRPASREIADGALHYQAAAAPVVVGGRVVGALLLGSIINRELAEQLGTLTRSEVTFASRAVLTATTLEAPEDREALGVALRGAEANPDVTTGAIIEVGKSAHRHLTVIQRLPDAEPGTEQYFVLQRSLTAETAFLKGIQTGLVQLGIIATLVTLLACFFVAERITRPVQHLVRGAEEMERGNYDYPLGVAADDEVGELARRFSDMRQQQRDYVRSLRDANRLRLEFINVASHELRTPLSVIRGFQELLTNEDMGPLNSQQRHAIEVIGRSTDALESIAEGATRVSQIEGDTLKLERSGHDLGRLVEQALTRVAAASTQRSVTVTADVGSVGRVFVDGARFVEALTNLVSNGVRFTPDGGRVSVRARREGGMAVIDVTDTGVGIPPERQADVFDRPFLVRSSMNHHSSRNLDFNSGGLGMGLAIARGIIHAHRGTLSLDSQPGRGTTVTLRIPDSSQETEALAA